MMLSQIRRFLAVFTLLIPALALAAAAPDATVEIPMRDGFVLPADVYLPPSKEKGGPCLLVPSPAGRQGPHVEQLAPMAQWGYVVVIQDTRSATDTLGKTMPYLHDGWGHVQDGYDTVEWLSESDWTNGKIGTVGASALGITQLLMAPSAPPSLQCQYIRKAAPCLYNYAIFQGGQLSKEIVEGWLGYYANHPSVLNFVLGKPNYDDFWQQFNAVEPEAAAKVKVPAVHVGGWFDIFLEGSIDGFLARNEKGGEGACGNQKLVIGPWSHFWPMDQRLGDFAVPDNAKQMPEEYSDKAWFDYYLKGVANGVTEAAPISYYVMGPLDGSESKGNTWRTTDTWPIPSTATPLYLTPEGKLSKDAVAADKGQKIEFSYDPENPVPTVGGRNLFIDSGPKDQRIIEDRDDVLVFTSEPLEEELEVTGRVTTRLFFSSDVEDTDIAVRLCDVYPDGKSVLVVDGLQRVRRDGKNADCAEEVAVDLLSTSQVFGKGHRLRVLVSGSNYPCHEKSDNSGKVDENGRPVVAHNSLYLSEMEKSQLILPVVYGDDKDTVRS